MDDKHRRTKLSIRPIGKHKLQGISIGRCTVSGLDPCSLERQDTTMHRRAGRQSQLGDSEAPTPTTMNTPDASVNGNDVGIDSNVSKNNGDAQVMLKQSVVTESPPNSGGIQGMNASKKKKERWCEQVWHNYKSG